MKYYVGVKSNYRCDICRSKQEPTQVIHGKKYLYFFGGYHTIRKAIQVAMYQNHGIDTPQHKSILI
jgi:hypothetical protein